MIRCIAIDDSVSALSATENFISRIPFLELIRTFDNAFEAIDFMDSEAVDLIFTDVEMPALSGLAFLGSLRHRPYSIILSEDGGYAADAFDMEAVDYLIKPVLFDRFLRAASKVRELIRMKTLQPAPVMSDTRERDFLFVKSDYKTIRVRMDDILFIEGLKDYVKIHTSDKPILSLLSLRSLEQALPPDRFLRVHRSYIVALSKIDIIEKSRIRIGQHSITISDMYRDIFFKKIHPLR